MNVRTTGRRTFRNENEGRFRMPWRLGIGMVFLVIGEIVAFQLVAGLLSLTGV